MKSFFLFFVILTASLSSLFSYYNEKKYEGLEQFRKEAKILLGRIKIIDTFLPQNPTVFEVGAKDGWNSVELANMWPEGKIISFEANPNQFAFYIERAKSYDNMFGYNLAVNTYNGTAKFYLCWGTGGQDPIFEGASSLLKPSKSQEIHYMGPQIEVPCVIFDDWCLANDLENIDFMWLDLEGFELQFLNSSPNILKTVKVIYTETNFYKFRIGTTQYNSLKRLLENQGFKMIAHWYHEGLQGDAIFVRKELL